MTEQSGPSVAVVIPTYDHAQFLDDALQSVFAQTRVPDAVIVVDDGSHDDPAAVVAGYPGVKLIRQDNAGPSAARNRGLAASAADCVLFLDADDRLTPVAIEQGLRCHAAHPGCGFVYGGYRPVDAALAPSGPARYRPCGPEPYHDLLRGNFVGSLPAAMFDRRKLAAAGGFDSAVRGCEDYEVFLRLARHHPVASHPAIVADYRLHRGSSAPDQAGLLDWALRVIERHRPASSDKAGTRAYRAGRRRWKLIYANGAWRDGASGRVKCKLARQAPLASLAAVAAAAARRVLPQRAYRRLRAVSGGEARGRGPVDLGDLARAEPVGRRFGYDRGTPVDRWYIERFLARHAGDIRGRALEVGDAGYCRRFGRGITRQDVLDRPQGNPEATVTGDLTGAGTLPRAAFDCLVITQVIQLLYDLHAAARELHGSLRPGGVLLLTVPGVTSVDPFEWDGEWHWSLTRRAAERLFGEVFGAGNVEVAVHGNVYGATCFLQGLAVEEIDEGLLQQDDPAYPMLVCVRARRD